MKIKEGFNPIYYSTLEQMDKPLSALMAELRNELVQVRGKLGDIEKAYGRKDRIEHLEGGLTCLIISMYSSIEDFSEFEKKYPNATI